MKTSEQLIKFAFLEGFRQGLAEVEPGNTNSLNDGLRRWKRYWSRLTEAFRQDQIREAQEEKYEIDKALFSEKER